MHTCNPCRVESTGRTVGYCWGTRVFLVEESCLLVSKRWRGEFSGYYLLVCLDGMAWHGVAWMKNTTFIPPISLILGYNQIQLYMYRFNYIFIQWLVAFCWEWLVVQALISLTRVRCTFTLTTVTDSIPTKNIPTNN